MENNRGLVPPSPLMPLSRYQTPVIFYGQRLLCKYLVHNKPKIELDMLTLQGLWGHNVSSSNFQWQILSRVKRILIFGKLGSYRVTSLQTCWILIFKISMWEVFKKLYRKCSFVGKGSKHNSFTMKKIVGMLKNNL